MAASSGTEVSSGNTKNKSWLEQFGGLVIDYTRARYVDSELAKDDNNIPDQNDLIYRNNSSQTSTGTKSMAQTLIMGGVVLILGVVVLKVAKVF